MAGVHLGVPNVQHGARFVLSHKDPNHRVKDRTLFVIRCKTGKDVRKASKLGEAEVLVRPGTPFRVVDIGNPGKDMAKAGHTLTMVTLERKSRTGPLRSPGQVPLASLPLPSWRRHRVRLEDFGSPKKQKQKKVGATPN